MSSARSLALAAFAAAIVGSVLVLFAPLVRQVSCMSGVNDSGQPPACTSYSRSLLEDGETDGLIFLLAAGPLLLTASGMVLAGRPGPPRVLRWMLAGLFLILCVSTGFSIGIFYLPAALLGLAAVAIDRPTDRTTG